jgi:hypothetical protein
MSNMNIEYQFSCIYIFFFPFFADLDVIRELNMDGDAGEICPICHMPFDKGKKRKLTDACGHERCYMCMFNYDTCPLCDKSKLSSFKNTDYCAHLKKI